MTNILVITSPGSQGREAVAEGPTGTVRSTFDCHDRARLRLTPGRWKILLRANKRASVEMPDHDISYGHDVLTDEDADYLRWLEMPADEKVAAFDNKEPIAKWVAVVGVA